MLGLPKSTEVYKQLPKNSIYANNNLSSKERQRLDQDISRIYIVNEVTAEKLNLNPGEEIQSFFILSVLLKQKKFNEKALIQLFHLIPQNLIMVLGYENQENILVYRKEKLLQTGWIRKGNYSLAITGFNLDKVWENIIIQIGGITSIAGLSLDEQIALNDKRQKFQEKIIRLEKLAKKEKQPNKRFKIFQEITITKKEKEEIELLFLHKEKS